MEEQESTENTSVQNLFVRLNRAYASKCFGQMAAPGASSWTDSYYYAFGRT